MPEFTITDLPHEPTPEQTKYLTELVSDVVRRWEWERARPSHLCEKVHGGQIIEALDWQDEEQTVPATHDVSGEQTVTRTHELEPRCHDCGRGLHRPPGNDAETWLCPNALTVLPPGGPDTAIECGEKR